MPEIKIEKASKEKLELLAVDSWSIWGCEPCEFEWEYTGTELSYFLEGKVKVVTKKGNYEINSGDFAEFPKGLKCRWKVIEKIKKRYTFR